jgi:hypothetical protein
MQVGSPYRTGTRSATIVSARPAPASGLVDINGEGTTHFDKAGPFVAALAAPAAHPTTGKPPPPAGRADTSGPFFMSAERPALE